MRLSHYDLETPIELSEDIVNVLVIENPALMSKLISDMVAQSNNLDGGFTLWDKGSVISLPKTTDVIINPFSADINRREILAQLYSMMKHDALGEDMYMHTNKLLSDIENGFQTIINRQNPNIESDPPDVVGMFKLMNVRFEVSDSLLAKLCDYMDICNEYLKIRLFIFVNLKSFLSESELYQLYTHSSYRKHTLLLVENRQYKTIEMETVRIIDESLCEIRFFEDNIL